MCYLKWRWRRGGVCGCVWWAGMWLAVGGGWPLLRAGQHGMPGDCQGLWMGLLSQTSDPDCEQQQQLLQGTDSLSSGCHMVACAVSGSSRSLYAWRPAPEEEEDEEEGAASRDGKHSGGGSGGGGGGGGSGGRPFHLKARPAPGWEISCLPMRSPASCGMHACIPRLPWHQSQITHPHTCFHLSHDHPPQASQPCLFLQHPLPAPWLLRISQLQGSSNYVFFDADPDEKKKGKPRGKAATAAAAAAASASPSTAAGSPPPGAKGGGKGKSKGGGSGKGGGAAHSAAPGGKGKGGSKGASASTSAIPAEPDDDDEEEEEEEEDAAFQPGPSNGRMPKRGAGSKGRSIPRAKKPRKGPGDQQGGGA